MKWIVKFPGIELDLTKYFKWENHPTLGFIWESPTKAIPRILKEHYPEYLEFYLEAKKNREKYLNEVHEKISNSKRFNN